MANPAIHNAIMSKGPASLVVLILLACPAIAHADDSWYVGIGGAPSSLAQHPSVRMAQETVHIDPVKGKVRAEFVFVNDGEACNVPMGFPENGQRPIRVLHGKSGFTRFESTVDGEKTEVRRKVGKIDEEDTYSIWWVKTVTFDAGQRRSVVVEYEGDGGWDTSGNGWFDYVLGTGASWKGKIGSAKIVVDTTGFARYSGLEFEPRPTHRFKDRVEWHLVDFEPKRSRTIRIKWFFGFLDVFVNGARIRPEDAWAFGDRDTVAPDTWVVPDSFGSAPTKKGRDVEASAVAIAHWLGAKLSFDAKTASATFSLSEGKWVRVRPKDGRLWVKGHIRRLPFAPTLDRGRMRVPMAALAEALGGTAKWVNGKLRIEMPRP